MGNPAVNFSLNLIYISNSSGKISLIFVVNKPWVHSYLNMVTARVHNSYKRLIQSKKFGDSIMTVTTSSHSKKKTSRLLFIVEMMSILILSGNIFTKYGTLKFEESVYLF